MNKPMELPNKDSNPEADLSAATEAVSRAAAAVAKACYSAMQASVTAVETSAQALRENAQEQQRMSEIMSSLSRAYASGMERQAFADLITGARGTARAIAKHACATADQAESRVKSAKAASQAASAVNDAAVKGAQLALQRARKEALLLVKHTEESQKAVHSFAATSIAEAESASRLKSVFIANMSHEIRTPLAVIKGFAELLAQEKIGTEENQKWIAVVLSASAQLETLINDMLDISKIEAGKLDIERHDVPLKQIIADTETLLGNKAKEKGLRLHFTAEGLVPLVVNTDKARLRQILINIIGNAIKFTEEGQVEVVVKLADSKNPGSSQLVFTVRDEGIGITPEQEQRLFQSFSQADSSITRRFGGTGLGLSLSRHLAKLLGGDVALLREKGKGSVFAISIDPGPINPLTLRTDFDSLEVKQQHPTPRTNNQSIIKGLHILVAEDAPDLGALVEYILVSHGAKVKLVTNGKEAIHATRNSIFDMILMDIQMPIIDGYEATRQLRLEGFTLPIFALTAHAMKGERGRCLAAGFTEYLAKPVSMKKLLDEIKYYQQGQQH